MSQVNHDDLAGTPIAEWSSVQELRPRGIGKGIASVGATRAALLLAAEMAERRRKLVFTGGSGERDPWRGGTQGPTMNQLDLNGRNAVVTGGASGLGFAIAERLVASGAKVVIWDLNGEAAHAAGKKLGCSSVAADVSDLNSVTSAVQKTLGILPTIDIFINNAGISGPNAKLWEYPVDDWKRIFAVNVEGTFYCCRVVVPLMRERNYGRIVNIASVAGKDGNPNASAYSASKAAVIALTKSLGKELADTSVRVNCVTPAAVRTPLFAQMTQAHIDYMLSKIPLGRLGEPQEIAALVAWLASEECSFSTGAVFDLSGGRSTY